MDYPISILAGSTRDGSYNRRLADLVAKTIERMGLTIRRIDLRDHPLPIYDADLEARHGMPDAANALQEQLRDSSGVFLASPEYNANVTPLLLNAIAWVSRIPVEAGGRSAFATPVYALGAASPGGFGGYRGLMALRHTLELQLGAHVLPAMVSVPAAHEAFDHDGNLRPARVGSMVDGLVADLVTAVRRSKV